MLITLAFALRCRRHYCCRHYFALMPLFYFSAASFIFIFDCHYWFCWLFRFSLFAFRFIFAVFDCRFRWYAALRRWLFAFADTPFLRQMPPCFRRCFDLFAAFLPPSSPDDYAVDADSSFSFSFSLSLDTLFFRFDIWCLRCFLSFAILFAMFFIILPWCRYYYFTRLRIVVAIVSPLLITLSMISLFRFFSLMPLCRHTAISLHTRCCCLFFVAFFFSPIFTYLLMFIIAWCWWYIRHYCFRFDIIAAYVTLAAIDWLLSPYAAISLRLYASPAFSRFSLSSMFRRHWFHAPPFSSIFRRWFSFAAILRYFIFIISLCFSSFSLLLPAAKHYAAYRHAFTTPVTRLLTQRLWRAKSSVDATEATAARHASHATLAMPLRDMLFRHIIERFFMRRCAFWYW